MLWELRAEPLPGAGDSVLVEMRQVPGYLDFLAEIMPADVRQAANRPGRTWWREVYLFLSTAVMLTWLRMVHAVTDNRYVCRTVP